ncbi:MAG: hypothetical protein RLZZ09_958, partial [Pseudomonadota bacterium]|jgi:lysozyme family protein
MRDTINSALRLVFGHEGGYSNRKTDRGGPTKYGITKATLEAARGRPVSNEDVKALTLDEAVQIYARSYWVQSGGDALPAGLDYAAFDFGVNSGPNRAVKVLQQALGVTPDGWVGEKTLAAVSTYPGGTEQLIRDYCEARMRFLRAIKGPQGWAANGRGWTIRVTGKDPKGEWKDQPGVIGNAIALAQGAITEDDTPSTYEGAPEGGDAKGEPKASSPWFDPGVLLPGLGGLLGSVGALFSGSGPVQWALAGAILIAVGVGAWLVVGKLKQVRP